MPVALVLLAAAFTLGGGATTARFLGASTLLAVLGYAFVLYRIGVRL